MFGLIYFISLSIILIQAIPNPTTTGYRECKLTAPSTLCDPDGIFTLADRHHLDHELKMFEARTRRPRPWNLHASRSMLTCEDKGITPAIAVVRSGNAQEVDAIIEDMKANWTLDSTCNNTVFIVFSATETQFSVSRPTNITRVTPLQAYDVAHFLRRQARAFQDGNYGTAFLTILQQTWERSVTQYTKWNATRYPNPMMGEHRLCKMSDASTICDPDEILDEEERLDLKNDASIFEYLTTNMFPYNASSNMSTFCQSRGYTVGIAVMRNIEGGTKDVIQTLARSLLKTWSLDDRCKKALVIALSVDDRIFSVVKSENVAIDIDGFTKFFDAESENFHQSEIKTALANILKRAVQTMIEQTGALAAPGGASESSTKKVDTVAPKDATVTNTSLTVKDPVALALNDGNSTLVEDLGNNNSTLVLF